MAVVFDQRFKNTKMGVWFQVKMDNPMEWVAKRYDIEIASREEKWLAQYPSYLQKKKKKKKKKKNR